MKIKYTIYIKTVGDTTDCFDCKYYNKPICLKAIIIPSNNKLAVFEVCVISQKELKNENKI